MGGGVGGASPNTGRNTAISLVPCYPVGACSCFPQEGEFRFSGWDSGAFQITPLTQRAFFKEQARSAGAVAKSLFQPFRSARLQIEQCPHPVQLDRARRVLSPCKRILSLEPGKPRSAQGGSPSQFILLTGLWVIVHHFNTSSGRPYFVSCLLVFLPVAAPLVTSRNWSMCSWFQLDCISKTKIKPRVPPWKQKCPRERLVWIAN